MAAQATYGIDIVANNKTRKGAREAEKTVGQIPKHVGGVSRKAAEDSERLVAGAGRSMVRTFGQVEKAAARVFGTSSITGGITSRLGGITQAASSLGTGLGEASVAGGVLEGTLGAVGVAAAGTIGVLAAAAYGAFKLADGWAKGAASIGRTAEIIGVGTKAMQEFSIAAERVGVDRNTATGAVGGLSQTLNDAKYGRNNDALALLAKLGVSLQTNADGTVNVDAMLPAIASAIARQNSSGRRTAARILGIPEAALPAFSQGGAALSADMADAGKRGPVISDGAIEKGKRLARRDTIGAQIAERGTNEAKEVVADGVKSVGDAVLTGARQFSGSVSRDFVPGAKTIDRAADKMDRAVNHFGGGAISTTGAVIDAIRRAGAATGVNSQSLLGIAAHESGLRPRIKASTSSATGLFQFLDATWLAMLSRHGGQHGLGWAADAINGGRAGRGSAARSKILGLRTDPYINALMGAEMFKENSAALAPVLGHTPTTGEAYMAHFLGASGAKKFFRAEGRNPNAGAADIFPDAARANRSVFYDHGRERSLEEVARLMADYVERPVKIEIDMRGAAPGTKVTASTGGKKPAKSQAMRH